jgi:putative glycerol-1-phosphate prenyltransferase
MNTILYRSLFAKRRKTFFLLIDPEKTRDAELERTVTIADRCGVDGILVGGSLLSLPIDQTILTIKKNTGIPVLLFPGSLMQLSSHADGILLMSLLSGRNPEYLIGNHVLASRFLQDSGLEIIPTGYILVDGSHLSAVEYISNTRPIPSEKSDIVVATALAGEQLGLRLIYLEAGSGARATVQENIVNQVKQHVAVPLVVGGGIRSAGNIRNLYRAGANGVVIGTAVEENSRSLSILARVKNEFMD